MSESWVTATAAALSSMFSTVSVRHPNLARYRADTL